MASRPCESCGQPFEGSRPDRRFCSSACRLKGWVTRQHEAGSEQTAYIRLQLREIRDRISALLDRLNT